VLCTLKILYADYTDVGGRGNNEDAFAVAVADHGHLFLVADGLGGHDKGEEASELAVKEIKRIFLESGHSFDPEKAILSANELILKKQKEEGSSMKTTVTLAWVREKMTVFAHVGDSRIYAFDKNGIVYQSPDHSVSYLAFKMGEISLGEIRGHRDRNKLTRALGVSEDVSVHTSTLNNSDYMGMLLCSDGLWEYVYEDEMISLLQGASSPKEWIEKMRKLHAERVDGKHDNNTAVAVITDGYNPELKELGNTRGFVPVMGTQLARGGAVPPKRGKGGKAATALIVLFAVLLLAALGFFAGKYILGDKQKEHKYNTSAAVSAESIESGESYDGSESSEEGTLEEITADSYAETGVQLSYVLLSQEPRKMLYSVGEEFDAAGIRLILRYSDGSEKTVEDGFVCTPDSFETEGVHNITISYEGKEASVAVLVKDKVVSSIRLASYPVGITYAGEPINTEGLQLTVVYSNGTEETIDKGFSCSPASFDEPGDYIIAVSYERKEIKFVISVAPKEDRPIGA